MNTVKKNHTPEYVKILEKYLYYLEKQNDPQKVFRLKQAIESLMVIDEPIDSPNQLKHLKGIGSTTLGILEEYEKTGLVQFIEKEKLNPLHTLCEVYGIGASKARSLISKNIKNISDLRKNKTELNNSQIIGLKYYDDIKLKIPRNEINKYRDIFSTIFQELNDGNSSFEIVGSYRRGKEVSGDIDFIITNKENKSTIFDHFLNQLKEKGYILEFLSKGKVKSLTVARLPNGVARRLDFLYCPPEEFSYAILYFTGSKYFNTAMRQRALNLGFSLNEHRLINKETKEYVKLPMPTEKHIFAFLGMKYKEPHERIDRGSVELIDHTNNVTFKIKKKKNS